MNADEIDVYRKQGFGGAMSSGNIPALLLVDFVNGFADPDQFGGPDIIDAIQLSAKLLTAARESKWPIAFTRIVFANDGSDANLFSEKVPSLLQLTENNYASQIVPALTSRLGELIVRKRLPSAFAETELASWLTLHKVDTVVVVGCTTSGCVRASVVDAMGAGFRPIVISDCVADRARGAHQANLFDLEQKYATVMTLAELRARHASWFSARSFQD